VAEVGHVTEADIGQDREVEEEETGQDQGHEVTIEEDRDREADQTKSDGTQDHGLKI